MDGFRFYAEYKTKADKRKNILAGTVIALLHENKTPGGYEAIVSVMVGPDTPVANATVSYDYLRTFCKRIPEEKARKIHPTLFLTLDQKSA